MDLIILAGVAAILLLLVVIVYFLQTKKSSKGTNAAAAQQQQRAVPQRVEVGVPRRAQIARNQRLRLRQNTPAEAPAPAEVADDSDAEDEGIGGREPHNSSVLHEKMGTKKRAKMEAKEQKRLQREQELYEREKRKEQDAKDEAERKEQEQLEAESERKRVEAERLAKEQRERKEHEEYMKMKAAFSIEEEGFDEDGGEDREDHLADFIKFVKENKVVILEDLAIEFKLKTQQAIDRIQELQANGTLTGVIDDRGKFIYVSEEELAAVAKFIKQRGRVSISELAESSNNLINLVPVVSKSDECIK